MAETGKEIGGVRYESVEKDYFENRQLHRKAGWVLLWGLGVGAVISGDFFGWNFGLTAGGFWGLTIATFLMAIMYLCMVYSIAELSTALPHAGGFYSFTRNAFGPWGGFIVGVTDLIEYVITPAVIVVGIGGYLNALIPSVPLWVWWLASYAIFVGINIWGVELTLKVGLGVTLISMVVLAIFYVAAISSGAFRWELLFNVPADPGQSATWLPKGWGGVFAALPFAIWFYLAIEELPLAAEETVDTVRDMPKALILGIFTLLVLSLFTLILNSGVGGGAAVIGESLAPLNDGFLAIFGGGATTVLLTLIALTGLVASFHTIIYAYGRVYFALSRAGYLPRWISLTSTRFKTPHVGLILGGVIGFVVAVILDLVGTGVVGAALLNMAVFGAVISYTAVMLSYIKLNRDRPDLPRPYKSPLGVPGAAVGATLSFIALLACFANPDYRPGVYGVAVFLVVNVLYFAFVTRHRLVAQAPEEEVALMAAAQRELKH
ncbi:MAG: ethanolamine permease [Anaerolineae bacterium]|nr:ethanolamine permease [Anaerolineae bacterium]MCI0610203.1 ethanolamine permease [Anaerolineae bacterium]